MMSTAILEETLAISQLEQQKHRCIGRYFRDGKPYWRVCIMRQGKFYQKTFSDRLHDGNEAALHAALQWRDHIFEAYPANGKLFQATHVRKNNTSGRPGVFLRKVERVRRGKALRYQIWQAQTPEGMKPFKSRSFSIQKYGAEQAFKLAVAAREVFEAKLAEQEQQCQRATAIYCPT
ncbi:MAG: AP2 domain-containing protein [Formivibrio sp.]|nr:AP2 domain-containing protein [Formivibrio sp.]